MALDHLGDSHRRILRRMQRHEDAAQQIDDNDSHQRSDQGQPDGDGKCSRDDRRHLHVRREPERKETQCRAMPR